jgi:hypothetical protein
MLPSIPKKLDVTIPLDVDFFSEPTCGGEDFFPWSKDTVRIVADGKTVYFHFNNEVFWSDLGSSPIKMFPDGTLQIRYQRNAEVPANIMAAVACGLSVYQSNELEHEALTAIRDILVLGWQANHPPIIASR